MMEEIQVANQKAQGELHVHVELRPAPGGAALLVRNLDPLDAAMCGQGNLMLNLLGSTGCLLIIVTGNTRTLGFLPVSLQTGGF